MTKKHRSASFHRSQYGDKPPITIEVEEVADGILQCMFYLDLSPGRVDNMPWHVVEAIYCVGSWLDFHKYEHFNTFILGVISAFSWRNLQKLKDKNKPPKRS